MQEIILVVKLRNLIYLIDNHTRFLCHKFYYFLIVSSVNYRHKINNIVYVIYGKNITLNIYLNEISINSIILKS